MNNSFLLLLPISLPIVTGILIKALNIEDRLKRQWVTGISVVLNFIVLLYVLSLGELSFEIIEINEYLSIYLNIDDLSRLFTLLVSILWMFVTFYSYEYMKHEGMEVKYFSLLFISLGVMIGIGFSGNIFTFYLFYEFLTLSTFPLVMHSMKEESMAAAYKYLMYSLLGGTLVFIGMAFISQYGFTLEFIPGGVLNLDRIGNKEDISLFMYLLMFVGFGSKAGMFPLHDWLPKAHPVAPSSASALLSGIITKAGVLGIIRTTYYLFGTEFLIGTWAQNLIIATTLFTIFMGSMLAYKENLLKKRLAYSSVSQVSYVLFGLALMNVDGITGGGLHIVFHAFIKNVLFLCAGSIIYMTGKTHVDELKGIGKSMPITMWCFTLASLALIGIPPASGFVSKWYLAMGGLAYEIQWLGILAVAVLMMSALLTAGYLLSIVSTAFFPGPDFDYKNLKKQDPNNFMKIPMILLAVATIWFGMFPTQLIDFVTNIANNLL